MSCCCCPAWLAVPVIAYIVYKFFFAKKDGPTEVLESNWKKDTVYLYQFPRAPTVPSVSPFCLKLETLFRINKIPYENRFLMAGRSQYGLLPFVELNGEHIADSQIVEEKLKKHFNVKPLHIPKEEALARTLGRMVDNHTFHVFYKYKMYDDPAPMISSLFESLGAPAFLKPAIVPLAAAFFKYKAGKRISACLGMFSDDEFMMLLRKDLDTLRDILGSQKFMFGDDVSSVDCTVFGHLASMCFVPFSTPVSALIREEYPTLMEYQQRIRQIAFPDDFEQ